MTEIKRYEHVHLGGGEHCLMPAEDGDWIKYEDHAAVVAELNEKLSRYTMSPGQYDQRRSESDAVRVALGFAADANDVSPSDLLEKIAALNEKVQALAAQKRIAELEANARISQQARDELLARAIEAEDELARRDALEPVSLKIDLSGISEEAIKKVISNARQVSGVICETSAAAVLPNELDNESGFVDLYRNGYNKAIPDAREMGCKSAPVVELPPDYSHSPDFTEYHLGWNSRGNSDKEQLEAAGIKWKIID